jgi:hypothetical protein
MVRRLIAISMAFFCIFSLLLANRFMLAQADPQKECLLCHEKQGGILKARHGLKSNPSSPAGRGQACTACHGINPNHASDPAKNPLPMPYKKGAVPSKEQTQTCLGCHAPDRLLANWATGRHARGDIRCNDCHVAHKPQPKESTVENGKNDPAAGSLVAMSMQVPNKTCIDCHTQNPALSSRVARHRQIGNATCSSCHNPHGGGRGRGQSGGGQIGEGRPSGERSGGER